MSAGEGTGGSASNCVHPTKITLPAANASIAMPRNAAPARRGPPTHARPKHERTGSTISAFHNQKSHRGS